MSVATMSSAAIVVGEVQADDDAVEVHALLHDHVEWVALAAGLDLRRAQPALGLELTGSGPAGGPGTTRFLARLNGAAVGTVSIAVHEDGTAELKRMFVRPVARGHGVADALLGAALARAADDGCPTIWLETMRGPMDRAITVYRRHGFVESTRRESLDGVHGVVVLERALAPEGGRRRRRG